MISYFTVGSVCSVSRPIMSNNFMKPLSLQHLFFFVFELYICLFFPVIWVFLFCLFHVLSFPPSERVGIRCDPLHGSCRPAPSMSPMYVSISHNSYIQPYLFVCVLPKHSPDYVTESSGATPCSRMVTILESLEASLRKVVLLIQLWLNIFVTSMISRMLTIKILWSVAAL